MEDYKVRVDRAGIPANIILSHDGGREPLRRKLKRRWGDLKFKFVEQRRWTEAEREFYSKMERPDDRLWEIQPLLYSDECINAYRDEVMRAVPANLSKKELVAVQKVCDMFGTVVVNSVFVRNRGIIVWGNNHAVVPGPDGSVLKIPRAPALRSFRIKDACRYFKLAGPGDLVEAGARLESIREHILNIEHLGVIELLISAVEGISSADGFSGGP